MWLDILFVLYIIKDMLALKAQKDITGVKDIIKDKAEKLAAAVYLVTNFLNDSDEIKWKLRAKAINLKVSLTPKVWPVEAFLSDITEIVSLINIAVLDARASAMNFSILREGYLSLQTEFQSYAAGDWYKNALLPEFSLTPNQLLSQSKTSNSNPSMVGLGPIKIKKSPSNNGRQEKIVNFIKQHRWSSIREIAKFLPGIGSKTIQRELARLIRTGTLKKTGERRWSRYGLPVRQPAD